MPLTVLTRLTAACTRRAWLVIGVSLLLTLAAGVFVATHFSINTNTDRLMPPGLPWVEREHAYQKAFPPKQMLAVIRAPTPELAADAANRLVSRLRGRAAQVRSVEQPQNDPFLLRAGLLFPPLAQVERTAGELGQARPLLGWLAADPTLRGVLQVAIGVARQGQPSLDRAETMLADTLDQAFAGTFPSFSWQALLQGRVPDAADRRQLLPIDPVLNFAKLRPGLAAASEVRAAGVAAEIGPLDGATLRLTGQAPVNDEQFATLSNGAALNGIGTAVAVLVILWLALRSGRIVLAVVLNLIAGLVMTAAAGLITVGAFNLISIAFAVLFVGLGADFGIQFGVRYRAERHEHDDVGQALSGAATKAGTALALAAAGVTVGFFCFLPTDYRGVSELGEIAGTGMVIAFLLTMTLLPALLSVMPSPGEPEQLGYAALAPVDDFLGRHRIAVVVCTIGVVLAGTPLLARLRFDFDPMHLQDPNGEAVATYRALGRDPGTGVAAVDVTAPSLTAAQALAKRLQALPTVAGTRTVAALVPDDQAPKLAAIQRAGAALLPALEPAALRPAPDDAETVAALRAAAAAVPAGAAGARLKPLLLRLADASPALRGRVGDALVLPLRLDLDRLRLMLRPEAVTTADLPEALRRDWLLADGTARVQVLPRGNPNDSDALARFAREVLSVAPGASGTATTLWDSERTVVRAFVLAGIYAVLAIAVILWIVLRRLGDVLLTLVPLLVAAGVTLEVTVLLGQRLNFANIIALPLLLGVGVAFKIYYILAWRRGATHLLQSTLTRAVFFSALTTMTAFGSLWLSKDPGMSSMGKLMALALVCTLLAAVLFQPALMGPPRGQR